mgnify:CR=1 FL=1
MKEAIELLKKHDLLRVIDDELVYLDEKSNEILSMKQISNNPSIKNANTNFSESINNLISVDVVRLPNIKNLLLDFLFFQVPVYGPIFKSFVL